MRVEQTIDKEIIETYIDLDQLTMDRYDRGQTIL